MDGDRSRNKTFSHIPFYMVYLLKLIEYIPYSNLLSVDTFAKLAQK